MAILTTSIITVIVTFLAKEGATKVYETVIETLSIEAINKIKNVFTKDGKPKEVISELQEKPDSVARQNAVKALIEKSIEDDPEIENAFMEFFQKIPNGITTNISHSKNVNTGDINSDGVDIDLRIGDGI